MLPILLALVFVAIISFVVIAGRPDEFLVSRSTKISAPAEKVFPHINDLHAWESWSPWAKLYPNAKNSFSGAASGFGSAMSWDGNKKVGTGKMTITDSRANEFVRLKVEFIRPFAATNTAKFTFKPDGDQTAVTWNMTGKNNFFFKLFGLFLIPTFFVSLIAGIFGPTIGFIANAWQSVLEYISNAQHLKNFVIWNMASLSNVTGNDLLIFCTVVIVCFVACLFLIKPLNALLLGDEQAYLLGINISVLKNIVLVLEKLKSTAKVKRAKEIFVFTNIIF